MGLFQKFKDVFKSKKEREEELKEILDVEESLEDEVLKLSLIHISEPTRR